MTSYTHQLLALLLLCVLAFSCGDDIDCDADSLAAEFNAEVQRLNNQIIAFNANPTTEACEQLLDATRTYIDNVEPIRDCAETAADRAEFDDAIAEARDLLNTTECP
ncbi:MAG: hypothetical protein AAFR14_04610 [Bacteroidota bacterium]